MDIIDNTAKEPISGCFMKLLTLATIAALGVAIAMLIKEYYLSL